MAQTPKKFLDANGLTYFASLLNDYPTNVVLQTVIDAIDQVKADKTDIVNSDWNATSGTAEILNKPTVPTKTSDLTNDSGYITSYTETDPTVPAWAKQANKPTYTAGEISGLQTLNNVFTFSDSTWTISNNGTLSRDGFYAKNTDLTYNNAARIILVTNTGTNNPFSNQTFFITKVENNYYSDDDNRYSIQGIVNNKLYNFIVRIKTQTTASFESHNVVDLSNYAEINYVDTAIAAIEIPTAELDANVESMLDSFNLDYTSNSSSPNVWQGGSY